MLKPMQSYRQPKLWQLWQSKTHSDPWLLSIDLSRGDPFGSLQQQQEEQQQWEDYRWK
jgi:hypothetical protein